jgi:cell division protein FtsB
MMSRALFNHFLLIALFGVFCFLNSKIWFSENGFQRLRYLQELNAEQSQMNASQQADNDRIAEDIASLKQDTEMVEYAARSDLGMVSPGETYYQFAS